MPRVSRYALVPRPRLRRVLDASGDERRPRGLHPAIWAAALVAAVALVASLYLLPNAAGNGAFRLFMLTSLVFLVAGSFMLADEERQRALEAKRLKDGRCPACGYDQRATPRRCPECGENR